MAVSFHRRGIEDNVWQPEISDVDFTQRLHKYLGGIATGTEMWTAWAEVEDDDLGAGYVTQCTPENTKVIMSELDDDSDAVLFRDDRDGQWFRFFRAQHQHIFDYVAQTLMPWSVYQISLVPQEDVYSAMQRAMTCDLGDFIPDEWDNPIEGGHCEP